MKAVLTFILALFSAISLQAQAKDVITTPVDLMTVTQKAISDSLTPVSVKIDIDSFDLQIIPPSLGVSFYQGNVLFLSPSKNEQRMSPGHLSFGNIEAYFATIEDSVTGTHYKFSPLSTSPFSFPCDAVTFSNDGKMMYFTKISKSDGLEKIYEADSYSSASDSGGWSWGDQPLAFCTEGSRYTHPALSATGRFLIFASDRKQAGGDMDLYFTTLANGKWIEPESLGSKINTSHNEMFPFLDRENNLYYSSDGQPGFGGYDIFICHFNGKSWDGPENLSDRINTSADEVAFTIRNATDRVGFYTVRQKGETHHMQLYKITIEETKSSREATGLSAALFNLALSGKESGQEKVLQAEQKEPAKGLEIHQEKTAETSNTIVAEKEKTRRTVQTGDIKKTPLPAGKQLKTATKTVQPKAPIPTLNKSQKSDTVDSKSVSKPTNVKAPPSAKPKPAVIPQPQTGPKVVYRVQFASSTKSKNSYTITVDGKSYKTFQYFYKGAYRQCVGDYNTLPPAKALQDACRLNGFPQAFVVVFVDGQRSVDTKYFR